MSWLISNLFKKTLERVTGMVPAINSDHAAIHEGEAFRAVLEIGDFGEETKIEYSLKTPADLYVHFKNLRLVAVGGTVKVTIKRGTEENELRIDSAGEDAADLVGPNNLNDTKNIETGVVIKQTPTYVTDGDDDGEGEAWEIVKVLGDDTNQFTSVAETQTSPYEELVFKPDTYYVIELEEIAESPTNIMLTMFWYEEEDG